MKRATHYLIAICVCGPVSFGAFQYTISETYELGVYEINNESLLISGAGADQIWARGSSYVEVQGTAPLQEFTGGIHVLDLDDNSTVNVHGGEIGAFHIYEGATAILEGGRIDYLDSYQYVLSPNQTYIPHIEIVSTEYDFDSSTNKLTGVWMDDSTFDIQLVDQSGYDPVIENIFFTPEPATLCMMGVGVLLLRRRSDRR